MIYLLNEVQIKSVESYHQEFFIKQLQDKLEVLNHVHNQWDNDPTINIDQRVKQKRKSVEKIVW